MHRFTPKWVIFILASASVVYILKSFLPNNVFPQLFQNYSGNLLQICNNYCKNEIHRNYNITNIKRYNILPSPLFPGQEKLIVIYTTHFLKKLLLPKDKDPLSADPDSFICPKKCVFSLDKNLTRMADAVLFNIQDLMYFSKSKTLKGRYPSEWERKQEQVWIAGTDEAPLYHNAEKLKEINYIFNWTATYRLDADVYWPYGYFYKISHPRTSKSLDFPNATSLRSKRLAVSLISNCKARGGRDAVLTSLKKYITIDAYGRCGNLKCPDNKKCRQYLGNNYKFFLAFENSLCQDYATEKFFEPFQVGMVPVTYGLGSYSEIAPPHSYIDAFDFPNTKALADYLLYLDKNDEEYLRYFEWKKDYTLGNRGNEVRRCQLCLKLWNPIEPKIMSEGFHVWQNHKRTVNFKGETQNLGVKLLRENPTVCVPKEKLVSSNYFEDL